VGHRGRQPAFTLIEVLLVLALLALLTGWVAPVFFGELERRKLTESASQLRSLLVITRAHAMSTGKRFRLWWDEESQQPIVEYEPEPIDGPDEFVAYEAAWTGDEILLGGVNCHEVRLGRPVYLEIFDEDEEGGMFDSDDAFEQEELRPEVVFDPTGQVEWATFVLADAELGEMLEDTERTLVVLDGRTGGVSIRAPLSEEELAEAGIERKKLLRRVDEDEREMMTEEESGVAEEGEFSSEPAESAATDKELSEDELAEIEEAIRKAGGGR
jgi:prepilin-type N-terminal cleavage/methylation domain-containing protein